LIGETYVQLYHRLFGLSGVCLRYFNVYGRRKGVDGGYPACIPIFFKQRAAGEPLTIVGDGDQTRDYVHVTDVAAANLAAWQSDIHDGRAYNVGTQTEISVQDVANLIGGTHTYLPPRIEIKRSVAQTARAAQELGWTPSVSFDAGMNDLAEWWGVSLQQNQ
jgi:UDP-glucose 4-epimerase